MNCTLKLGEKEEGLGEGGSESPLFLASDSTVKITTYSPDRRGGFLFFSSGSELFLLVWTGTIETSNVRIAYSGQRWSWRIRNDSKRAMQQRIA
jgi:hypothetical protein